MSAQSLQEYLARKREDRQTRLARKMAVPVPGMERLAGRYRLLRFEDQRAIQARHTDIGTDDDADALVNAAADALVKACEDLLDVSETDEHGNPTTVQALGKRWMAPDISELFAIAIPPGTTAIQALRMVLDSDQIMEHYGRLTQMQDAILAEVEEEQTGEAEPSPEG